MVNEPEAKVPSTVFPVTSNEPVAKVPSTSVPRTLNDPDAVIIGFGEPVTVNTPSAGVPGTSGSMSSPSDCLLFCIVPNIFPVSDPTNPTKLW